MKTLTVMHVLEALESGIARHVVDIVRHVDAHHVVVVPPERVGGFTDTTAVDAMRDAGAAIHIVPMRRSPLDRRNVAAVARIRRLLSKLRPSVVHGHSAIGGAAARLAATGSGIPRVYTPNGLTPSRAGRKVERLLASLTDCFIAVSPSEAALARRLALARPDRIEVIPNAIEQQIDEPVGASLHDKLGLDPATPLVGTVARLVPQKAPDVFVRACGVAAAQADAHFVLVGDGPLAPMVREAVARTGLDGRLHQLGGIHGATDLMGQFDVFVLCSRYEGGPYTPLEAMRAGTPVVLTDVVGNRDTIEHERSGLLAPPDDPHAVADAVLRLLADHDLRARLGNAGRERVQTHFSIEQAASRLADLYRSLHARTS